MRKYSVSIRWSDEDNGFIAQIPEAVGLSAFGTTQQQALNELCTAAEAYFESLVQSGNPLPVEEKMLNYSGQLRLRMPKSLHALLAWNAENNNVSLNTYIVTLLSERRVEKELLHRIVEIEKKLEIIAISQKDDEIFQKEHSIAQVKANQRKYPKK